MKLWNSYSFIKNNTWEMWCLWQTPKHTACVLRRWDWYGGRHPSVHRVIWRPTEADSQFIVRIMETPHLPKMKHQQHDSTRLAPNPTAIEQEQVSCPAAVKKSQEIGRSLWPDIRWATLIFRYSITRLGVNS